MAKVLIQTLDIRSGNYGGTLQAFALQKAIRSLGHEPVTVLKRRHYSLAEIPLTEKVYNFINKAFLRKSMRSRYINERRRAPFERFIKIHIRTMRASLPPAPLDSIKLNSFSTYIVGSDQVWRCEYSDIPASLFNYVSSAKANIISYAASFGREDLSSSDIRELQAHTSLAARFDAISVRERSGIELCNQLWGLSSVQVIDPTLLLEPDDYRALVMTSPPPQKFHGPGIFEYVLDKSDHTSGFAHEIVKLLHLDDNAFVKYSTQEDHDISHREKRPIPVPSIEEWINNIDQSSFVVTDSFHGCCFAILFNKPFVALGNHERGQARFKSLLSLFDLEHRLISSPQDLPKLISEEISWDRVNSVLAKERERGLSFLGQHIHS